MADFHLTSATYYLMGIFLAALFLQLLGLLFAVLSDSYIDKGKRKVFFIILFLVFSMMVQNYTGFLLDVDGLHIYVRTVVGIYGYGVRPMVLVLFCYIVDMEKEHRWAWILVLINALIHMTALFSDVCFMITEDNRFQRGPLGYTCHVVSGIMLLYLLWLTFRKYGEVIRWEALIPVFNAVVIIISVIVDSLVDYRKCPVTVLTVAVVECSVFYYIWLHQQFVREHENDLKAQQRIRIMRSQIQPHFLYNTIATFKVLCRKDPEKASEVAGMFGSYLRKNLAFLDTEDLVPLEKELEYTKLYTGIEMVRFENICVTYRIEDRDFFLPPLTIQPMVENAIRHGVRIREAGHVDVCTWSETGGHVILIQDNGTGFDAAAIEEMDGSHIGIRNVKERIESMCNGSLTLQSIPEKGTTVTIRIPGEKETEMR